MMVLSATKGLFILGISLLCILLCDGLPASEKKQQSACANDIKPVTLTCKRSPQDEGNPDWMKDDKVLRDTSDTRYSIKSFGEHYQMFLFEASVKDSGEYVCQVHTLDKTTRTEVTILDMKGEEECSITKEGGDNVLYTLLLRIEQWNFGICITILIVLLTWILSQPPISGMVNGCFEKLLNVKKRNGQAPGSDNKASISGQMLFAPDKENELKSLLPSKVDSSETESKEHFANSGIQVSEGPVCEVDNGVTISNPTWCAPETN